LTLKLSHWFNSDYLFQVYVIGGDGTQRGAGVIFEVSTTVDSLKVFSDLFELYFFNSELIASQSCIGVIWL
jgi:hypothetical protein